MKLKDFLEMKRMRLFSGSWWSKVFWYSFLIGAIILIVTNTYFLIYNLNNWEIHIDKEELFLTFVGFLFAFAGINIYSIFNTNIEEEKDRLNKLGDTYDLMILETNSLLDIRKNQIQLSQYSLIICNSIDFNSQFFEYLRVYSNLLDDYDEKLNNLKKISNELYESNNNDNLIFLNGLYHPFRFFIQNLENNKTPFFERITNEVQEKIKNDLHDIEQKLERLLKLDYDEVYPEDNKETQKSIKNEIKEIKIHFANLFTMICDKIKGKKA